MNELLVFYDKNFPFEGVRPTESFLRMLEKSARIVTADQLKNEFENAACLIHLHGRYFPKDSWEAVLGHLREGKALIHTGGAPFKNPVRRNKGRWHVEAEQTGYHQQLHIHETELTDFSRVKSFEVNGDFSLLSGRKQLFDVKPAYSLVLHVTKYKDVPPENGSGGPMDAHLYPLLKGVSVKGRHVASPIVLLENTKGEFTGGRWLFVNQELTERFWNTQGLETLLDWADYCAQGVTEIWIKTNYASYLPGEQPQMLIQMQSLKRNSHEWHNWSLSVKLETEEGKETWAKKLAYDVSNTILYDRIAIPIAVEPGLYKMTCEVAADTGETRLLHHGFWGYDQKLLEEGSPLACNRDYFEKDGRPFPIVGMTYMTSDVARKFLFIPNVNIWHRDMEHMKSAGINYLRTGLWTGWRQVMFVDGHPYEEVMRAVDAFILTAKKHSLEVTFNFFSFTPEGWEGENPYLDPRSVEAQKRFIAAVVSRHKKTTNIQWDLINEPSMFDPERIFRGPQSSQDKFETHAYQTWLENRHNKISVLQEHWNMTPEELPDFSSAVPPERQDISFSTTDKQSKKSNQWLDYTLFTMAMHNRWAEELTRTIKSIAPAQLVTVGQDEAMGGKRPSPFFYGEAVDYTTVHSWWLLDHLVWDSVFTKIHEKPNLVQETGIMHVERPDGRSKRSGHETKAILERKYAYAFATGGAGAVQWLWNTNHYMDNVNESNIGTLRSDLSEKPEADVSYDFGGFISGICDLFGERKLEDIVVIYPFSNDFSNREFAFTATAKITRLFSYHLKTSFRGMSEYHLDALKKAPPKLIIVPSPHNFKTESLYRLMKHIKEYGGTLLWTGPMNLDEYWRFRPRSQLWGRTFPKNILREERVKIADKSYSVSFLTDHQLSVTFGKNRMAELETEVLETHHKAKLSATEIHESDMGKGALIWSPLPLELNNRDEPLLALYEHTLKSAGVLPELEWIEDGGSLGIYGKKVTFKSGSLFVFVSEDGHNRSIKVKDPKTGTVYSFKLESGRSVLFAVDKNGKIQSVYRPDKIKIAETK